MCGGVGSKLFFEQDPGAAAAATDAADRVPAEPQQKRPQITSQHCFFFLFRMYPTDPGLSQKQQTTETGTLFNMQWRTKTGPHYLPNSMQIVFISSSVMLSEAKLPRGEHALCQRPTIKKNKKQIKRQTLPSPISYLHANRFRLAYISSLSGIQ